MLLRRLGLFCVVLAMFAIAGGPWAVLQTVAWGEMLRDYYQRSGSCVVAVEQTFDGKHPCDLCRQIAVAKDQQGKDGQQTPVSTWAKDAAKVKALPAARVFQAGRPEKALPWEPVAWTGRQTSRVEAPPTPPPRRVGFVV